MALLAQLKFAYDKEKEDGHMLLPPLPLWYPVWLGAKSFNYVL